MDCDVGGRMLATSTKRRRLLDAYRFVGFRPMGEVRGLFGDPYARIVTLVRRSKKQSATHADGHIAVGTIARFDRLGTFRPAACASYWRSRCGVIVADHAASSRARAPPLWL